MSDTVLIKGFFTNKYVKPISNKMRLDVEINNILFLCGITFDGFDTVSSENSAECTLHIVASDKKIIHEWFKKSNKLIIKFGSKFVGEMMNCKIVGGD